MSKDSPTQIAVWYFVGATFLFALTSLYFPDADDWVRITTIIVGLVLVALGGVQLGREMSARKKNR